MITSTLYSFDNSWIFFAILRLISFSKTPLNWVPEKIPPWIKEYSPYELVSADDPPVFLYYSAPPALGKNQKDPTHTSNFGVKL